MLTSSKFALSLVFVLATASAAMAAPKQPVRPNTAIQQAGPCGLAPEPGLGEIHRFGEPHRFGGYTEQYIAAGI